MNRFMKSQVNNALLSLKVLDQSIEMAAKQDDGEISKKEQKEIKQIRKAIRDFEKAISKIK